MQSVRIYNGGSQNRFQEKNPSSTFQPITFPWPQHICKMEIYNATPSIIP